MKVFWRWRYVDGRPRVETVVDDYELRISRGRSRDGGWVYMWEIDPLCEVYALGVCWTFQEALAEAFLVIHHRKATT